MCGERDGGRYITAPYATLTLPPGRATTQTLSSASIYFCRESKHMERTLTLWVDINRLSRSNASGLVLRMMMAANDIALANWGLTEFKKPQPRLSRHMQNGACLYFIRLQCGHLSEALKLVVELNNDPDSKARLERCNETAKLAYSILNGCLPGGVNYQRFTKWVERIRHNVSFHYDPSRLLKKANS